MQYKYRSFNVGQTRTLHPAKGWGNWYVGGVDPRGGAGVLEWAFDKGDAEQVKAEMKRAGGFQNLEIGFCGEDGQIHTGTAIE